MLSHIAVVATTNDHYHYYYHALDFRPNPPCVCFEAVSNWPARLYNISQLHSCRLLCWVVARNVCRTLMQTMGFGDKHCRMCKTVQSFWWTVSLVVFLHDVFFLVQECLQNIDANNGILRYSAECAKLHSFWWTVSLGPDLQRILCETYDSAALTPDLRRACELRAINKKS